MRHVLLAMTVAIACTACVTRPAATTAPVTLLAALRSAGVPAAFPDALLERLVTTRCAADGARSVIPFQSLAVAMIETEIGQFDAAAGAVVFRIQRDVSLCGAPESFGATLADLEAEVTSARDQELNEVTQLVTFMSATVGSIAPVATAPEPGVLRLDVELPGLAIGELAGVSRFMVLAYGLVRPSFQPVDFAAAFGTSEPSVMVVARGTETLTTLTSADLQSRLGGMSADAWLAEARQ